MSQEGIGVLYLSPSSHFSHPVDADLSPSLRRSVNLLEWTLPHVEDEIWPHRFLKVIHQARTDRDFQQNDSTYSRTWTDCRKYWHLEYDGSETHCLYSSARRDLAA